MRWQRKSHARRVSALCAFGLVAAIAIPVTGSAPVAGATARRGHASASQTIVKMAIEPGWTITYLMPFNSGQHNGLGNTNLEAEMWPTLYTLGLPGNVNAINTKLSLASPPVYSHGDTQVSFTLKRWKWSDGAALTARDVTFFMNLLKANRTTWASWAPGNMPTNVASISTHGSNTVVITLKRAYNPTWFTDTELAHIVPMPQQAWDKESATGPVGTYDTTTAGAKAVYSFLNKEGESLATYSSNPLWQVVDGPWKLKQFTTNGRAVLSRNKSYSGSVKPAFTTFEEIPFTSDTAEFNALISGDINIGYVPPNDLTEIARVRSAGYRVVRSSLVGLNAISMNYNSPVIGPLVKQLYIRKALNDVMDQPAQVKAILHGIGGYPDYGPIPPVPATPFLAPIQRKSPFSIGHARHLLTSHGWKIPTNGGVATCEHPGTGTKECGAGIGKGKTLNFTLDYTSQSAYLAAAMANYKSDASEAGIGINLVAENENAIVGAICGTATCNSPGWQLANWGSNFAENFDSPYPEGTEVWQGHEGMDYPVTHTLQALLSATKTSTHADSAKAMQKYDSWVVQHALEVWQLMTYNTFAVSSKIHGVFFDPITENVFPQSFSLRG